MSSGTSPMSWFSWSQRPAGGATMVSSLVHHDYYGRWIMADTTGITHKIKDAWSSHWGLINQVYLIGLIMLSWYLQRVWVVDLESRQLCDNKGLLELEKCKMSKLIAPVTRIFEQAQLVGLWRLVLPATWHLMAGMQHDVWSTNEPPKEWEPYEYWWGTE